MTMIRLSKEALIGSVISFAHDDTTTDRLNPQFAMNHIDVISLDGLNGSPVIPTVGTFEIYVRTDIDGGFKRLPDRGVLDATKTGGSASGDGVVIGASFAGFPLEFKIVPVGVDVATAYRVDLKQGSDQLNSLPDNLIDVLGAAFIPRNKPFINPEHGAAMNQDATATGTPVLIHNGNDSALWTGSEIVGTTVDFSSALQANSGTQSVRANSPAVGDMWQFDKGSTQDLTGFVAISFAIYVSRRWSDGDSVSLYAWDTNLGQIVGNKVLLEDHISEFEFDVWQQINVKLSDLGITDATIYAFRFEQEAADSLTGDFFIDDFQIEETGTIIEFTVAPDEGKNFYIDAVRMTFVKDVIGTAARNYDDLLGVAMNSGININRLSRGVERVGRNIATLYDFESSGFDEISFAEGATHTMLVLEITFTEPVLLESFYGDTIFLGVNDNLTPYTKMSAIARGKTDP